MAVIHGGYTKVAISNNATFTEEGEDWTQEFTNLKQGTTYEADPLQDDMADGMPAQSGIRYRFTVLATDFTAAQYSDVDTAKLNHTKLYVRFYGKDVSQHVTLKEVRLTSLSPMFEQVGAFGHMIIQGVGFGGKVSDITTVTS